MDHLIRCVPFMIMVDWDDSGKYEPLRHPFYFNGKYLSNRILYYLSEGDAQKAFYDMPLSSVANPVPVRFVQSKRPIWLLDLGYVFIQFTTSML